jgi:hypothetical protein
LGGLFKLTPTRQLLEVDIGAGRSAAIPRKSHHRSGGNDFSSTYANQGIMPVEGAIPIIMLYNDGHAIAMAITGEHDSARADGTNRSANRHGNIYPPVEDKPATAKGVKTQTNAGGDYAILYRQIYSGHGRARQIQPHKQGNEQQYCATH